MLEYFKETIEETIQYMNPDNKFKTLNLMEDILHGVRDELSREWTYCAGCHKYVKVSERTSEKTEKGQMLIRCGNCGEIHHVWGIPK